jgi:hypothetical protein
LSLTKIKPVSSDCVSAFSGQAVTHFASSQARQANAKLKRGFILTMRIRDFNGLDSPFSWKQANSQIPQPVHFEGSTETNFLCWILADGISVFREIWAI